MIPNGPLALWFQGCIGDDTEEILLIKEPKQDLQLSANLLGIEDVLRAENPFLADDYLLTAKDSLEADTGRIVNKPDPLSQKEREALTQKWRTLPLVDLLPPARRDEAAEIIRADPNKRKVLELCKLGVFDCWVVTEELGLPLVVPCSDGRFE